ncbi:MAG: hypothetical protein AAFY72_09735, partial [Cyanobacteria bacterium J06649_4]
MLQNGFRKQKFLLLILISAVYLSIFFWLDALQAPLWKDENHFWKTVVFFSDRIIPTVDDLRNYKQLNTPLTFVIFGGLENLFNLGPFAPRLLNLTLS